MKFHSSRTELEIRLRQLNLPGGTILNVVVNNAVINQMFVDGSGESRLRLRSDQGGNIPAVVVGTTISIQNGGSSILSGVFGGATGTPNPSPSPNNQGRFFETHPTGSQVTPPVSTAANGEVKVFLNTTETQATITGGIS